LESKAKSAIRPQFQALFANSDRPHTPAQFDVNTSRNWLGGGAADYAFGFNPPYVLRLQAMWAKA